MSSPAKPISLRLSAIVHATEDSEKVIRTMRNVCQLGNSAHPVITRAKGHHGNQITTLVSHVKNARAAEECLRDIWSRLNELDKEIVRSSLASRVDHSGTLFLRIDKQEAFRGRMHLQDSDPIKVGISFKTPKLKHDRIMDQIWVLLTEISAPAVGSA